MEKTELLDMKIAILYIALGKYDVFWKDFYLSAEMHFIKSIKKDYYIFTDAQHIYKEDADNVKKIPQENLGWPGNTLFRFNIFLNMESELEKYDYIFFFNANYIFVKDIDVDFLPINKLLVVQHPGYYNKRVNKYPYEKNPNSLAYVSNEEKKTYVQGCLEGGSKKEFINLIRDLAGNIKNDYSNGIIAKWHDESHLNKYICSHEYKLMHPGYAYPEGWEIPYPMEIMTRDKRKIASYDVLRGTNSKGGKAILKKIKIRLIDIMEHF